MCELLNVLLAGDVEKAFMIFNGIVNAVVGVLGGVVLIYAIYMGYKFMTAEDDEKRRNAKAQLSYAIIGAVAIIGIMVIWNAVSSNMKVDDAELNQTENGTGTNGGNNSGGSSPGGSSSGGGSSQTESPAAGTSGIPGPDEPATVQIPSADNPNTTLNVENASTIPPALQAKFDELLGGSTLTDGSIIGVKLTENGYELATAADNDSASVYTWSELKEVDVGGPAVLTAYVLQMTDGEYTVNEYGNIAPAAQVFGGTGGGSYDTSKAFSNVGVENTTSFVARKGYEEGGLVTDTYYANVTTLTGTPETAQATYSSLRVGDIITTQIAYNNSDGKGYSLESTTSARIVTGQHIGADGRTTVEYIQQCYGGTITGKLIYDPSDNTTTFVSANGHVSNTITGLQITNILRPNDDYFK